MRQSQVKPGVVAMLSLGRRGAVRVTVRYQFRSERAGDVRWSVVDSSGQHHVATPRQLRPVPVTDASGKLLGYVGAPMRGQTIDLGDTVIETTLHRLG